MNVNRDWVTPITMGAFALMATTGVLMFFGLRPGLIGAAHEWLSWLFLAGVAGHVLANSMAFLRHLRSRRALTIVATFLAVLVLAAVASRFLPRKPAQEPGWATPVRALAQAPLPVLAQVGGVSPEQMRERIAAAGIAQPLAEDSTVASLVGSDYEQQKNLLRKVLAPQDAQAAKP
ncbi:MAG: DUF4405 domain-containing protein [Burkholderiaceae bacterium]|nr:DUF4405 domain-containing protein [Burkholderiaceae bacterium]